MQPVPYRTLRFSTDAFPQDKRLEAYREIYGRTIIKHDLEIDEDQPFRFDGTLHDLPGLGVASYLITPCRAPRRAQHIDGDDLVFTVSFGGYRLIEQRGREAAMQAGEAVLTSSGDPGVVEIASTCRLVSLRLSRDAIRPAVPDLDACLLRTFPRQNEALRLLANYLRAVRDADELSTAQLRAACAEHIRDLVLLVLGGAEAGRQIAEESGLRAARRTAVLRAIENHSGDPGLSANAIAATLGVTPRYVHLLLEETGKSFTRHVLQKRLEKAAALLRDPRWRERRIAEVAAEAGFTDLSYFGRAFRRQYDATPSDIRDQAKKSNN